MNLVRVSQAIRDNVPDPVAPLFSLREMHEKAHQLGDLKQSDFAGIPAPWPAALAKLVHAARQDDEKVAIEYYSGAVLAILGATMEPYFYTCIVRTICRSIFEYARLDKCYNEVANIYRKILRGIATRRGPELLDSPLLAVVNGLISLHLLRNDFQNAGKVLQNVAGPTANLSHDVYPASEIATFLYLSGKVNLVFQDHALAREQLEHALRLIPNTFAKDRRLVLSLLLPLNLARGILPSDELVEKYNLHFFDPLVSAVRDGDLSLYELFLAQHQLKLIRMSVWELVVMTRKVVERTLLQMIYIANGRSVIDISVVHSIFSSFTECTRDEIELMVCNLYADNFVQANVAHKEGKIVFKGTVEAAFPPI